MGDGVNNLLALQVALQIENILAQLRDFVVLRFGNSPGQQIYFAWVLGKIRRDLFAEERIRQVRNLETTCNRIVIGDGNEIHPARFQFAMKIARLGVTIGKIETAEEPFFRTLAAPRMNMKIAAAHACALIARCSSIQAA